MRRLLIDTGGLSDAGAARRLLASLGRAATAVPQETAANVTGAPAAPGPVETLSSLDEVERRHVLSVLAATGGNRTAAARILGIERKTLSRKLKAWGAGGPEGDEAG